MACGWTLFAQHQPENQPQYEGGVRQSPINIVTTLCKEGKHQVNIHYEQSHEHVNHGSHTVRLDYDPGSYVTFDGEQYAFAQFHFHTPSEHLIDYQSYPLEMHMVHTLQDGSVTKYLVVAILFEEGKPDHFIEHFLGDVPNDVDEVDFPTHLIDINEELTLEDLDYYHYKGSLTTPPYSETVSWVVISELHQASIEQIELLKEFEGVNNRKTQSLEHRQLEKCTAGDVSYFF